MLKAHSDHIKATGPLISISNLVIAPQQSVIFNIESNLIFGLW
jgi:hypothetical protein